MKQVIYIRLLSYDVRVWEEHSVTHFSDAVYPQGGLRDVSLKRRR
jgi:hypothetical protein